MKRIALLLALVLVVAACGDDDAGDTTTTQAATATTTAAATETTSAEDMTEETMAEDTTEETMAEDTTEETMSDDMAMEGAIFEITSVSFGAPMVVITNVGTETGNLGGHWICQRPGYQEVPAIDVGPGESVAISLGGNVFLPPPGTLTIEGQLNIGGISASSGEIGLYSSNAFGSADAMVSYVEWGNTGHGRSGTAVEAGLWDDGGFVATTDETAVIQQDTIFSMSSTGWSSF
ncbi:MAG: hypothetical protein V3S62_02980 [Acidimicrobiia bacterium]